MLVRQEKADLWIGCGLLALCGFMSWRTTFIKKGFGDSAAGPSFLPWLLIGLIALLSVLMILRALRAGRGEPATVGLPEGRVLAAMGGFTLLMIAYAVAFMPVGYIPSTIVTFVLGLILLGERDWRIALLFPVGMTLAIYFGFTKLLSVWLP